MFLKKKGPIDVPGGLILLPMFAAHPYNHFCTEYPPGSSTVHNSFKELLAQSHFIVQWYMGHGECNDVSIAFQNLWMCTSQWTLKAEI